MSQQHQALRLLVQGDIVAVQPAAAKGATADTLAVQLSTGKVRSNKGGTASRVSFGLCKIAMTLSFWLGQDGPACTAAVHHHGSDQPPCKGTLRRTQQHGTSWYKAG
jgi:hypothetical protein